MLADRSDQRVLANKLRGLIGPFLVSRGSAFGLQASDDTVWHGYVSYSSLAEEFTTVDHPSPRYWLLWPGILCLVAVSMTGEAHRRIAELGWLLIYSNRTRHAVARFLA